MPNSAINTDVQKRRFALLLHAGYGECYVSHFKGGHTCLCLNIAP
jgi:hypothetical protein